MRRHTHPLCVSMNFAFYRADGRTDQIMIPDGHFLMCCRVILGLNARLCRRADSLSALGLLACITIPSHVKMQGQTFTRSHTNYPLQAVLTFVTSLLFPLPHSGMTPCFYPGGSRPVSISSLLAEQKS